MPTGWSRFAKIIIKTNNSQIIWFVIKALFAYNISLSNIAQ
jgi:hypothetical protein